MRQPKYKIVMSGVEDCLFYNTKREVQKYFNKLLRSFKKDENYIVTRMNEGWFEYKYLGEYGIIKGEAYIARNW